jgi:hypothetical protein
VTSPSDEPTFDITDAYPEVAELRALVRGRDWPGVQAFVARAPGEPERAFLTQSVAGVPGSEEFLAERVAAADRPGLAHTMLGGRYIAIGWEIRTTKRAQYVSREQFAALHEYLCKAEQLLIDATVTRPDDVAGWNERLSTARGLGLGLSEARRRYDRLAETDPHNYRAQWSMVQQLCPKWSGSWEALFPFARECVRTAPPGAHTPVVILDAHVEHSYDAGGDAYWKRADVRDEVYDAAARSIDHPDFRRTYGWVEVHNVFAYVYSLMGDHTRAAASFRAIGNLGSRLTWGDGPDGIARFRRHRASALAKG